MGGPLEENVVTGIGQSDPPTGQTVADVRGKGLQLADIGAQQKAFLEIELFDVEVKGGPVKLGVKQFVAEVHRRQLPAEDIADQPVSFLVNLSCLVGPEMIRGDTGSTEKDYGKEQKQYFFHFTWWKADSKV